jgi:uncharacterized protein YutE (UPF0331/DUF86 family)/predicted nucleotidyltransferase
VRRAPAGGRREPAPGGGVEGRLAELVAALRQAGARFAYLFGSGAEDPERPGSDIDLAAWFGRTDVAPWTVPGVDFETVDLVVLDTCPLDLAGRVATAGRLLYDDDPPARVRWEATTRKRYFDEQPRRDRARRDFVEGARRRGDEARPGRVVDPDRLRTLLQHVSDRTARLRRYTEVDRDELLADPERLAALDYLFQTAIEACIDAAQHVCASEGWGPPRDNADAMRVLRDHGLLDAALADLMVDAVRFRNVLVHLYADVDHERVLDHLAHLGDLDRFVAALARLLED